MEQKPGIVDVDAVVIGAGAAGLAAARSLARRSYRVVLLEARDRVGGRALSQPSRTSVPMEYGAEFIHGEAIETLQLLREAGTESVEINGDAWTSSGGRLSQSSDDFRSAAGIFAQARALSNDETVAQFLQRFDADVEMQRTVELARAFAEGFDAADPAIASAQGIADEWCSGVDFAAARPVGGYGPMFERLRKDCIDAGVQMRFSTSVSRISVRDTVEIESKSAANKTEILRARAGIVTVPVGVLQARGDAGAIEFDPELPAEKRAALSKIEMGHVVKVELWFRSAFWERIHDKRYRDAGFFRCASEAFPTFWTQFPIRSELMVAWAGGPKAMVLAGVAPAERIECALESLGKLFGAPELVRDEFETGATHDWSSDPFARGAYSYLAVGGRNARTALAAPVKNLLFFAGEATSNDGQGGTVNGALETGERAALEAAKSLGARNESDD